MSCHISPSATRQFVTSKLLLINVIERVILWSFKCFLVDGGIWYSLRDLQMEAGSGFHLESGEDKCWVRRSWFYKLIPREGGAINEALSFFTIQIYAIHVKILRNQEPDMPFGIWTEKPCKIYHYSCVYEQLLTWPLHLWNLSMTDIWPICLALHVHFQIFTNAKWIVEVILT